MRRIVCHLVVIGAAVGIMLFVRPAPTRAQGTPTATYAGAAS